MNLVKKIIAVVTTAIVLLTTHGVGAVDTLPALGASKSNVTVSGLSSGAYMAVQLHVSNSSRIHGAAVLAGGPYYCAKGITLYALYRCMDTLAGDPNPYYLADFAKSVAVEGKIDPIDNLASSRVYIFGGTEDPVVKPPVVKSLIAFYQQVGVPDRQIKTDTVLRAGHTFATMNYGVPCAVTQAPFIGDCGVDMAGELLSALYDGLNPPAQTLTGRMVTFNQGKFLLSAKSHGMDDTAYVWIPKDCEPDASQCQIHVALHGCEQGRERIGDTYATMTGYNRWADSNKMIVLYPQAFTTGTNPNGCWDWFAYDDVNYYTKNGRQIKTIMSMVDRLQKKTSP